MNCYIFIFFVTFGSFYVVESVNEEYLVIPIGIMASMFAKGPGDRGSIPGRVIPKTQKMVLDASLLNTQHYKVRIKGKVGQYRKRSSALHHILVLWISKREPSGHPRLRLPTYLSNNRFDCIMFH